MNPEQILDVQSFAREAGFNIEELNPAAFVVVRSNQYLTFSVTVAHSVLERYTEIEDIQSGLVYKNWFDYLGYGNTDHSELVVEFVEDLKCCFTELSQNIFRVIDKNICQKRVFDKWEFCNP